MEIIETRIIDDELASVVTVELFGHFGKCRRFEHDASLSPGGGRREVRVLGLARDARCHRELLAGGDRNCGDRYLIRHGGPLTRWLRIPSHWSQDRNLALYHRHHSAASLLIHIELSPNGLHPRAVGADDEGARMVFRHVEERLAGDEIHGALGPRVVDANPRFRVHLNGRAVGELDRALLTDRGAVDPREESEPDPDGTKRRECGNRSCKGDELAPRPLPRPLS